MVHLFYLVLNILGLRFYISVNSYGFAETVSSPNHTFFPGQV